MKFEKNFAKNEIINRFLRDKSTYYELSAGETELITLSSNIIEELLEDMNYLKKENKRLLNEKLNQEEIVDELRDEIKKLNNK